MKKKVGIVFFLKL